MAEQSNVGSARRPSPKALLELAAREKRGKLKVFLGMAPGVGKTYAMLSAARVAKDDGVEILIGVVETHGRSETAALLGGLEVLPRKAIEYRGRTLMEFDIEAAIARHPKLLLIDELAHTNAPGALHAKRHQDVEEALRAGIDVWTTLNIQHLESLTDVVERITGISVRETVPDTVLVEADEIVVVDLPPEDLIQRLKDGKVYLPDNARRAVDQFFKVGNLIALRELALRRAADRVDEQMLEQLRQRGVEGPWPTAERLLVCVGPDELSETVVRAAARLASAQKSDWVALHLRVSDREVTDRRVIRRADKALRLAERLGATTVRLNARDLTAEILTYARRNNITQIVIGRAEPTWLKRVLGRSLPDELLARARDISLTLIAPAGLRAKSPWSISWPRPRPAVVGGAVAASAVGLAVLTGMALERLTVLPNLSMVFLLAVLSCALRFGVWSAIAAALLSFLAYNFFFIEPRWSFTVAQPYELLSLLTFLVVAVITGGLAGKLREQAWATHERAEAVQSLYDFSSKLSAAVRLDDVLWALASQAASIARGRSIILMHDGRDLAIQGGWPPEDTLATSDWAAARWCYDKAEAAGRSTGTLPSAQFQFRPLVSSKGPIGVLGVATAQDEDGLTSSAEATLQSIIDQSAIAIERTMLVDEAAKAAASVESERLRNALLSSISHDLRTPLSSILGSVTSLRTLGDRMKKAEREDLLATIEEEAGRLSRFVSNLLDMTKLEAGAFTIRRDWIDVGDVARGAVDRARKTYPRRRIELATAPDLPLVKGDATLLEQVVFNLLDNADKYSGPDSVTRVAVGSSEQGVTITVSDAGIGIPAAALEKVFDKFYRVEHGDGRAPGTGLGLSICAGLVAAMGGTIKAASPVQGKRGTRVTIVLPTDATIKAP